MVTGRAGRGKGRMGVGEGLWARRQAAMPWWINRETVGHWCHEGGEEGTKGCGVKEQGTIGCGRGNKAIAANGKFAVNFYDTGDQGTESSERRRGNVSMDLLSTAQLHKIEMMLKPT